MRMNVASRISRSTNHANSASQFWTKAARLPHCTAAGMSRRSSSGGSGDYGYLAMVDDPYDLENPFT